MSNVVLIAKSVYVWLDQLSGKYQREIRLLSEIPDEELDTLARWGFSGLWLIGLWERSPASQKIKQWTGNPEAMASAYSLYDYTVAADLGGEAALANLSARCGQRGIRLASDMVPNHMGVYSRWLIEHPQWFIQRDHPPYPAYRYTGADLSDDERVVIQIEDGYWDRDDAAVVFKRIDRWTGEERYIYHGNDGTSMPWNDTAQLNFLLPEVREAVIQTILHVARKFPIIRFDAAMTLAKKHYQRLWFPQPGDGGAIPSRAEEGMTRDHFDAVFPKEFWREVVDRVAAEVPDTLLLAEAFWLMEGYFVRTLGMHRVYNSAFMNMLKMEDNGKYRKTVRNVLEFSPEILKRFVNFMNNPDEQTAVAQFGKEDKYIGVALLMVTLPGLPMFGHGQIEGFSEKYGMEYRRAYWDEQIDRHLVWRHEREIFPLMRKRHLFSGVENFAFFDFETPHGWVDENVFAYSNRAGDERAVILYNNAYNNTSGWLRTSTPSAPDEGGQADSVRKTLADALGLNTGSDVFYIFRDHQSDLEYLRSGSHLARDGIFAELRGYQYHAFVDFREIRDYDGSWERLARRLNGAGVSSIEEARREMELEPVLAPLRRALATDVLEDLEDASPVGEAEAVSYITEMLRAARDFVDRPRPNQSVIDGLSGVFERVRSAADRLSEISDPDLRQALGTAVSDDRTLGPAVYAWFVVSLLGEAVSEADGENSAPVADLYDSWILGKTVRLAFEDYFDRGDQVYHAAKLVKILTRFADMLAHWRDKDRPRRFRDFVDSADVRDYLRVNQHDNVWWFGKEQLEVLLATLLMATHVHFSGAERIDALKTSWAAANRIFQAAELSGYKLTDFVDLVGRKDLPNHRRTSVRAKRPSR
jgi:glycosidase